MDYGLRDRYANMSEQFINAYYDNTESFTVSNLQLNSVEAFQSAYDYVEGFPLTRNELNAVIEYYSYNREEFSYLKPDDIATFVDLYNARPEKFRGSFVETYARSHGYYNGNRVKECGKAKNWFKKVGKKIASAAKTVHRKVIAPVHKKIIKPVLKPVAKIAKGVLDKTLGQEKVCPGVVQPDNNYHEFPASDKIEKKQITLERKCNTGERDCGYHVTSKGEATNADAVLKYWELKPLLTNTNNPYDTGNLCMNLGDCGDVKANDQNVTEQTKFNDESTPTSYKYLENGVVKTMTDKDNNPKFIYKNFMNKPKDGVTAQQVRYDFMGEFGQVISATPEKTDLRANKQQPALTRSRDVVKKDPRVMWLYRTEKEIRYFNNEIFNDWMYMIQTAGSLRLILKEIREMVTQNLGLVLLNKVDKQFGPYVRGIGRNTLGLVGLPFGSPFIRIPNSYVLPYKGYMSEYTVDGSFDKVNVKYNNRLKHNNIVNTLRPNTKSKTFVPNNYIDNLYQTMYKMCKSELYTIDKEVALGLVIPNRGCQLFEAVSDRQDVASTQRIGLSTEMASLMKVSSVQKENDELSKNMKEAKVLTDKGKTVMPRVIVTFEKPMDQMLMDAYDDVGKNMDLHVPIVNIRNKDGLIKIDINTSSTDEGNKAYVYVSKSNRSLGSYVSGCPSKVNEKTNTELRLVNVTYDGNETKETPVVLMKRFRT